MSLAGHSSRLARKRPVSTGAPASGERPADGSSPLPWYRKPTWWATGAVLTGLAVTVVLDLPRPATQAGRQADLRSFVASVQGDVAPCSAGLHDAMRAYDDALRRPPLLSVGIARRFVQDGIAACTFTNSGIVALGNAQPPRSLASEHLGPLAKESLLWASLDAEAALRQLGDLLAAPTNTSIYAALQRSLHTLAGARATVESQVRGAQRHLGMAPTGMALDQPPPPVPAP